MPPPVARVAARQPQAPSRASKGSRASRVRPDPQDQRAPQAQPAPPAPPAPQAPQAPRATPEPPVTPEHREPPAPAPRGPASPALKTVGSVTCEEGGTEYKGATTNLVCNGKEGEPGEPGILHPGETLPEEATETGTWRVPATRRRSDGSSPISFAIPSVADCTPQPSRSIAGSKVKQPNRTPTAPARSTPQQLNLALFCLYSPPKPKGRTFGSIRHVLKSRSPREGVGTAGAMLLCRRTHCLAIATGGSFAVTAP